MKYEQFKSRKEFDLNHLISFAYGRLVEDPPENFDARLPAPPFLMVDRILSMTKEGSRGSIIAEQDIRLDAWYFQCHFPGDPVQPGCLCMDAIWQLIGFYSVWRGALGSGRALGSSEILFQGQIRPHNKVARFEVMITRFQDLKKTGSSLAVADGKVFIDDEPIASVRGARVGIFQKIAYTDYPNPSPHSLGGSNREKKGI
ncbi:MAG: bifunctional 3-hydroxydecanoyl-ACP dehydratase/trans-2-decenoyl-ACP isomerase [Desulfobacterium sp.]|nr:bifunctional 3-hydroxydecanoyl-ACP dehydratase/trans-2-decenoyl-ACP isomerase [Desulfobacterium sp.]